MAPTKNPELYKDIAQAENAFSKTTKKYKYYKDDVNMGRLCNLELAKPEIIFHEESDEILGENFIRLEYVDSYTNPETFLAETGVNTPSRFLCRRNLVHIEGGFDRSVKVNDKVNIQHFKKLYEKEKFVERVPTAIAVMEAHILATSFADVYSFPFDEDPEPDDLGEAVIYPCIQLDDPWTIKRPVVGLSWHPEDTDVLASSYCDHKLLPWEQTEDRLGFVWYTYNRETPYLVLDGGSPITVLEYNPFDPECIAGGLMTGQICYWDTRAGAYPQWTTKRNYTFYDYPTCMQWTSPTTGTELTVGALDGQILWFDIRKYNEPFDKMLLDMTRDGHEKLFRAVGVTAYQFDHNFPTKFFVGTTDGKLVMGNKKGKTNEEKLGKSVFDCSTGPVLNVSRNPSFGKFFFTIGDWIIKFWVDDYPTGPITWINESSAMLTCGLWSKVKNSVILVGRDDGAIDVWDFLEKGDAPVLHYEVSKSCIRKVIINEFGEYIASGDDSGTVSVMKWTKHFGIFNDNDVYNTANWLERESRREKLLDARLMDIALKKKIAARPTETENLAELEADGIRKAQLYFDKVVADVVQKRGVDLGLWEKVADDEN
ncbi:hypothetical protein O3M35_000868 [Rhynocoris fuscipes]|uniref:Uncharacterized protein n=1 Tax=Rhynocoris fuscipes TaxID=488301 RepID=A0AAW1DQ97_9HEMI